MGILFSVLIKLILSLTQSILNYGSALAVLVSTLPSFHDKEGMRINELIIHLLKQLICHSHRLYVSLPCLHRRRRISSTIARGQLQTSVTQDVFKDSTDIENIYLELRSPVPYYFITGQCF